MYELTGLSIDDTDLDNHHEQNDLDMDAELDDTEEMDGIQEEDFEDDGQPSEYTEWQDVHGGDDNPADFADHGE